MCAATTSAFSMPPRFCQEDLSPYSSLPLISPEDQFPPNRKDATSNTNRRRAGFRVAGFGEEASNLVVMVFLPVRRQLEV